MSNLLASKGFEDVLDGQLAGRDVYIAILTQPNTWTWAFFRNRTVSWPKTVLFALHPKTNWRIWAHKISSPKRHEELNQQSRTSWTNLTTRVMNLFAENEELTARVAAAESAATAASSGASSSDVDKMLALVARSIQNLKMLLSFGSVARRTQRIWRNPAESRRRLWFQRGQWHHPVPTRLCTFYGITQFLFSWITARKGFFKEVFRDKFVGEKR